MTLDNSRMFIPGSLVGDYNERCFLPFFFEEINGPSKTWYLGNLFMSQYYIVLDMTPFDEKYENYIQVALAQINPNFGFSKDPNENAR